MIEFLHLLVARRTDGFGQSVRGKDVEVAQEFRCPFVETGTGEDVDAALIWADEFRTEATLTASDWLVLGDGVYHLGR